jgi:hypothetical protein
MKPSVDAIAAYFINMTVFYVDVKGHLRCLAIKFEMSK